VSVNPPAPTPERPARAGFSIPRDIVFAPSRAFLAIAKTGEWLPAAAVIVAAGLATTALVTPAFVHIAAVTALAKSHHLPTAAQAHDTMTALILNIAYDVVVIPLLIAAFTATTLTAVARFKDPQAPYVRYFSLVANCLVPSALGNLAHALAVGIHSPTSFNDLRSFQLALPDSLGVFAAPGNDTELDFLSRFSIFDAWSFVLIAFGFSAFSGVRFTTSLIIAFVLDFTYAIVFG
jgi:hypothetical protein